MVIGQLIITNHYSSIIEFRFILQLTCKRMKKIMNSMVLKKIVGLKLGKFWNISKEAAVILRILHINGGWAILD